MFGSCFIAITTNKTFSAGLGELKVMRDWTGSEACGVMSTVVPGRMVNWLESWNISKTEQLQ